MKKTIMSNLLFAAGLISYGQSSTTSLSASNPQKKISQLHQLMSSKVLQ